MIHTCWILCLLISFSKCSEPLDCSNKGSAKTTMLKLKLDLLCGYDKYLRPVAHHENKTSVHLLLAPRIINFDDIHSTLFVKTWLSMNWMDIHLTWDMLQYDNIDMMMLDTNMVWIPDLSIYNSKYDVSLDQLATSPLMVDFHGDIYTFMSPEMAGHCVPNWANWPFDTHVCTITLGSRRYLGSTVDFRFMNLKGLTLKFLLPNKDWELVKTNTTRNETKLGSKNSNSSIFMVTINYDFTLRRHASVYIASYLFPGVVMMILSLGLLWIPSNQVERIAVLCTLVVIQSLYLQYLAYKIPANGDKTPYLVCFYRDCLVLTGVLVVQTLVTRSMLLWTSNPSYLQSTFRFIASNKALQFIFVSDLDPKNAAKMMEGGDEEGSSLVAADGGVQQWQTFVNIVNKAFFILLLPIYLLLSVSLLPLNYSFSIN